MGLFRIGVVVVTLCVGARIVSSAPDSGAVAAATASAPAPAPAPEVATGAPGPPRDHRWLSVGGLAGVYSALTVWAYFAWYHDKPPLPEFTVGGDGWFGEDTYAGGADKLGHAWANYAVSRLSSEMLIRGGWRRLPASVIAGSLSLAFFTFIEVKDGFYYQLSPGDMVGNTLGAALSVLTTNVPRADELVDFRVEYSPSEEYLDLLGDGNVNIAEDYSGQTYQLALKLSGIRTLRRARHLGWTRWLDVVLGYGTRNYKPDLDPADPRPRRQELFLGLSLDLQQVLDDALDGRAPRLRAVGHSIFEVLIPPYATLPALGLSRSPDE